MSRNLWQLLLAMLVCLGSSSFAQAQGPFGGSGDFLRRMDANNNGVLEPNELSDRSRFFIERAARDAGLDPQRPIPIDRLQDAMQRRFSSGGSGGYRGGSDGRSSDGRSWGGDRSSGDRSWGGRSSGDRSSSSSSAPVVASVAPMAPTGVMGFGEPTILPIVPGFGLGAEGMGIDPADLRDAQEKLDDADRNRDGFVDQEEARREDVGSDYWAYDRNADGKLSLEELAARYQARRVARLTAKVEQRDLDEARDTIRRYDRNNDGVLDEEEMRQSRYRDEYKRYDLNRDGKISQQEMAQRYAGRRVSTAPPPPGRSGTMMAAAGSNYRGPTSGSSSGSSGSSSRSSSSSGPSGASPGSTDRTAQFAEDRMRDYDKNKDGVLDRREFDEAKAAGRFRSEMSEYDGNGDGRITKEELIQRFQAAFGRGSSSGGSPGGGPPGGGPSGGPGGGFFFNRFARDGDSREGDSRDGGSRFGGWRDRDGDSRGGDSQERSRSDSSNEPAKKSYRFLSPTERLDKNLPDWFREKDANGDGQVAMAEFATTWTEKEANEFMRADLNGDGIITQKECLLGPAVSAPPSTGSSSSRTVARTGSTTSSSGTTTLASAVGTVDDKYRRYAESMVKKYDTNGDGILDAEELKSYSSLPAGADADSDGRVTVDELFAALSKKK